MMVVFEHNLKSHIMVLSHRKPKIIIVLLGLVLFALYLLAEWFVLQLNRRAVHVQAVAVRDEHHGGSQRGSLQWTQNEIPTQIGSSKNITSRSQRFPSVEQRVRLYMSDDWYLPPCRKTENGVMDRPFLYSYDPESLAHVVTGVGRDDALTSLNFTLSEIPPDITFSLDYDTIMNCTFQREGSMWEYCVDAVNTILPALHHLGWNVTKDSHGNGEFPVLLQFGDSPSSAVRYLPVPVIKKFRRAMTSNEVKHSKEEDCSQNSFSEELRPIVWKLETGRHFERLPRVRSNDIPWGQKLSKAIFRGAMTGHHPSGSTDHAEQCLAIPRCRLVYQHANSTLLDAQLINTFNVVPNTINGIQLVGPRQSMESLLRYKALVFLEGNDVSSGVKWALYSRSIVLMPNPTVTSWFMEELLEPWVHYIPIREDSTDVEEKIQWVLDHDSEAMNISKRATLWVHDLLFHSDAVSDDEAINREILRRYRMHWEGAENVAQ
jgi:hypothetical protein